MLTNHINMVQSDYLVSVDKGGPVQPATAPAAPVRICGTALILSGMFNIILLVATIVLAIELGREVKKCDSDAPLPSELYAWIPMYHQTTDYTCGPSSTRSFLLEYGIDVPEMTLAYAMGTNSDIGTNWSDVSSVIVSYGFETQAMYNMTIDDLKANLNQGRLTIVGYQAWRDPGTNYATDWNDGHYSVFIGWNATGIFLMDPWQTNGYYGFIPTVDNFPERWHFFTDYGFGLAAWMPSKPLKTTQVAVTNILLTQ